MVDTIRAQADQVAPGLLPREDGSSIAVWVATLALTLVVGTAVVVTAWGPEIQYEAGLISSMERAEQARFQAIHAKARAQIVAQLDRAEAARFEMIRRAYFESDTVGEVSGEAGRFEALRRFYAELARFEAIQARARALIVAQLDRAEAARWGLFRGAHAERDTVGEVSGEAGRFEALRRFYGIEDPENG